MISLIDKIKNSLYILTLTSKLKPTLYLGTKGVSFFAKVKKIVILMRFI
jgi:hypothetical protein